MEDAMNEYMTLDAGTKVFEIQDIANVEKTLENDVSVKMVDLWDNGAVYETTDGTKYFVPA